MGQISGQCFLDRTLFVKQNVCDWHKYVCYTRAGSDGSVAGVVTKSAQEVRDLLNGAGGSSISTLIRQDILEGRLAANARLKVAELASRYGTSTNPVREALQQLRGEGFVVIEPNRGARVRPIDEDFVRDIYEIAALIEPHLTSWFVGAATDADIAELEEIQAEIEALNFADLVAHSELDTRFHMLMYNRHYNRHAVELWWRHREILTAIMFSHGSPVALSRRKAVLNEHRLLIESIKAQDADRAARVIFSHAEGSGRHMIEQLRSDRRRQQ